MTCFIALRLDARMVSEILQAIVQTKTAQVNHETDRVVTTSGAECGEMETSASMAQSVF